MKGIWDEELDYPAEVGQGMCLMENLLLDVVQNVIKSLPIALPLLKIIGHKRIKFFAPVAGKRLSV